MSDTKNIFSGFKSLSKEQWKVLVHKDLSEADFEENLVWKTYEDFDVQPYYAREDISEPALTSQSKEHAWITYQEIVVIDADQANREAHLALSLDVRGLVFNMAAPAEIPRLLKGIDPEKVKISFSGREAFKTTLDYLDYLAAEKISPGKVSGFCDHDVLGKWITSDTTLTFEGLSELVRKTTDAPNFRVLHIHSGDFVNAGANFTQELAFTINKVVEYIDQLTESGMGVQEVVGNISFEIAITSDFFFEIAKHHAVRKLFASILKAYNVEDLRIPILSSSSLWSKSRYDQHVNMIRNTSEALSAVLGGCDSLLIKRHDLLNEEASGFSQRIAANISNLLREESYIDKIDNPVTGSYYIEWLADQLVQASLDLFKKTEEKGGLIVCIRSGSIQQQIKKVRNQKELDLNEGKFTMIGTNKYRIEDEEIIKPNGNDEKIGSDGRQLLQPTCLGDLMKSKAEAEL